MTSITCATWKELFSKLFNVRYTDYYRGLVAAEIAKRIHE